MARPRLLDLFCGAGGAAMGYHWAGFDILGVDIEPQPDYPFDFIQADAITVLSDLLGEGEVGLGREVTGLERVHDARGEIIRVPRIVGGEFDVQVDKDRAGRSGGHGSSLVGESDYAKPAFGVKAFAAIHASPPCQRFTAMRTMWNHKGDEHPDLLAPTRRLLEASGRPWVMENVPGAPMEHSIMLCGTMFGLGITRHGGRELRRHRLFETSFPVLQPQCQHQGATIGLYGDHARDRRRAVTSASGKSRGVDFPDRDKMALGREAMEMPWATKWRGISEAIPPAYTEFIGRELLAQLERAA